MLWLLLACTTYECEPVLQADGTASGFEACRDDDGQLAYMNRTSEVACSGDPLSTISSCEDPVSGGCSSDGECVEGQVCAKTPSGGTDCTCLSVCGSDEECPGGKEACLCALERVPSQPHDVDVSSADHCVLAFCQSDADCESGECGAVIGPCGWGIIAFHCRTKEDECRSNDECGSRGYCGSSGRPWTCSGPLDCE